MYLHVQYVYVSAESTHKSHTDKSVCVDVRWVYVSGHVQTLMPQLGRISLDSASVETTSRLKLEKERSDSKLRTLMLALGLL